MHCYITVMYIQLSALFTPLHSLIILRNFIRSIQILPFPNIFRQCLAHLLSLSESRFANWERFIYPQSIGVKIDRFPWMNVDRPLISLVSKATFAGIHRHPLLRSLHGSYVDQMNELKGLAEIIMNELFPFAFAFTPIDIGQSRKSQGVWSIGWRGNYPMGGSGLRRVNKHNFSVRI